MENWPHAPRHSYHPNGIYIVTAGTYKKRPHFNDANRLTELQRILLSTIDQAGWEIRAWAIFPNHYHFVAYAPSTAKPLKNLIGKAHMLSAKYVNTEDAKPGRKVWYQYWETELTFERSYYSRLAYVHNNAVHHGIASTATQYQWCSARWLEQNVSPATLRTIENFRVDNVKVPDDF